jgi:predicted nucleic acid-binding protein
VIAVDTSAMVAYLTGDRSEDLEPIDEGLNDGTAALPPVVLTELLSDPMRSSNLGPMLTALPQLEILPGYWVRAAATRAKLLARKLRAPMSDTFICQSCLDYDVPLLTRDADFRHFVQHAGLKLI